MIRLTKHRLYPHLLVFFRNMSGGYHALLIPSKENLDLLQNVDLFSSFNDSSDEIVHVDTDSDDPFDPADLVGLDEMWTNRKKLPATPIHTNDALSRLSHGFTGTNIKEEPTSTNDLERPLAFDWVLSSKTKQASQHSSLDLNSQTSAQASRITPKVSRTSVTSHRHLPRNLPHRHQSHKHEHSPHGNVLLQPLLPKHELSPPSNYATPRGSTTYSPRSVTPTRIKTEPSDVLELLASFSSPNNHEVKREPSLPELKTEQENNVEMKMESAEDSLKRPWHLQLPINSAQILPPEKQRPKTMPTPTIQLATQAVSAFSDHITENVKIKTVKPMLLSREQEYVRQLAIRGRSMFFTGSAGTGKSVLLRQIIKDLKRIHGPGTVAVTASTGLAAYHIGGITVHSFAGIGLGKGDLQNLIKLVRKNRKVLSRWKQTKVLIIDEISMIDGRLFDHLDEIARQIRRKRDTPFGGIQVIVCGDFYQLPPVSKAQINPDGTETKEQALFTFESKAWKSALQSSIILKEVFRQKGDQTFIDMLNDLRHGRVSDDAADEFRRLSRPLKCPDGIVPTELYSTRYEVENANNMKLLRLGGTARVYEARDGGTLPPAVKAAWLSNFLVPKKLFLKENAQVMCIKNFDDTLVNGSLGRVKAFVDRDTYLCRKLMDSDPTMPFDEFKKLFAKHRVAYSLSQKTSNDVLIDEITDEMLQAAPEQLDSVFNFLHEDKNFVSLMTESESEDDSRHSPSANFGHISNEEAIRQNKRRKLSFISKVEEIASGEKYPLVEFASPDGLSSRLVLMEPERWDVVDEATDEILVSRTQLPLMLAWAMSIHKSQGQTLSKVRVDLSRVFENGQAYVALSRAVAREGLQVVNFRTERVRTHAVVERFYETLLTTEDLASTDG